MRRLRDETNCNGVKVGPQITQSHALLLDFLRKSKHPVKFHEGGSQAKRRGILKRRGEERKGEARRGEERTVLYSHSMTAGQALLHKWLPAAKSTESISSNNHNGLASDRMSHQKAPRSIGKRNVPVIMQKQMSTYLHFFSSCMRTFEGPWPSHSKSL